MRHGVKLDHLACLIAALALAPACRRKAPGPEECYQFALAWSKSEGRRVVDRSGRVRLLIDEQKLFDKTNACLTTPFDRKVVRCVTEGGSTQQCLLEFKDRLKRRRGQRR